MSKEIALMITSRKAANMTAADVDKHTRNHWGIENKGRYGRDALRQEDHHQAWDGTGHRALASRISSLSSLCG